MTIVLAQNLRVPRGSLLVSRVVCLFITSAERKVKDSRRSGMCQSYHFCAAETQGSSGYEK